MLVSTVVINAGTDVAVYRQQQILHWYTSMLCFFIISSENVEIEAGWQGSTSGLLTYPQSLDLLAKLPTY